VLRPELYFPCLAPLEQGAIRLIFTSWIPTYVVIPVYAIDAYFDASPYNWDLRQSYFENMFGVTRDTVTLPGFPEPVEVYIGFYEFYLSWILYDPIAYGSAPGPCGIRGFL
jgi:hypothetical protein